MEASIFLYNYTDKLIISDIDGTITKSDILGYVCNLLGRDWTHANICKLFNKLVEHGYQIFYFTARSILQNYFTKR